MSNSIIIYLLITFGVIFICSLFFIFRKKEKELSSSNTLSHQLENELKKDEIIISDESLVNDKKINVKPTQENQLTTEIIIEPSTTSIKKEEPKLSISISSKTEKILLHKLQEFEESKGFIKKDVNLNNLAKKFDTNTKYLSEIIKTYRNKNFNYYLNDLRIKYLIHELNNNDKVLNTKVSYLASDFGFSSHSSFSTIFTQYIGQTPSEYIKNLKKEKATNSNSNSTKNG